MNSKSPAISTCRALQERGVNLPNATMEDIKKAVILSYKKDPAKFISMSGSSLWDLVAEELKTAYTKDC